MGDSSPSIIDAWRRGIAFRRKVRSAGLRIVRKGTLPVDAIQFRLRNLGPETAFTVRRSPHYALLLWHRNGGVRFTVEEAGCHVFRQSQYYHWHVMLRGFHHPRPDGWIEAMARRLLRLHDDIRDNGYRCRSVADRIAVFPENNVWDGGHRLACLAMLGWQEAPVVRLAPIRCRLSR